MIYIVIGVIFVFLLEYFTSKDRFKKYSDMYPKAYIEFGFWERVIGVLCWPILLGIFIYNFFNELLK